MTEPLVTSRTDWNEGLIATVYEHIKDIALNDMRLNVFDNQVEIISAEQMLDAYSSIGLPVHYNHWSFGKRFLEDQRSYQAGHMGLAYEIVINSNPCISYLMEENDMIMQTLVIAHAAFGHNHVFKNNYMFKEWTNPDGIIDYMVFAKNFIRECEEKYGVSEVESLIDAAHALSPHGVDKRKRVHRSTLSYDDYLRKQMEDRESDANAVDHIIRKTSYPDDVPVDNSTRGHSHFDTKDEENILYFMMKHSPSLKEWERELLRIIYKINQYFYPQAKTKIVNEGFATFTHYYILTELEKRGVISADAMIAWLQSHTGVTYQREGTYRFNPYALGFEIFMDIKRICEEPTEEDYEWFPDIAGTDWRDAVKYAVSEFNDESFIQQYLSPTVIRKWKLFSVETHIGEDEAVVTEISDDRGYRELRNALAASQNPIEHTPDIYVSGYAKSSTRTLELAYREYRKRRLSTSYVAKTVKLLERLWGHYPIEVLHDDGSGEHEVIYSSRTEMDDEAI